MSVNPYEINDGRQADLDKRFTYHNPRGKEIADRYVLIRGAGMQLAEIVLRNTPECREQSLALTKIEEAIMWANAGIARHE